MKRAIFVWLSLASLSLGKLEFSSGSQEIHPKADVTTISVDYEFTNKGDKPVTIKKSDPGCSCMGVQISGGKMKYAPGESGTLRATFDMTTFAGTVDKAIAIWVDNDADDKPSEVLKLRVHIPVLIALDPKTVSWVVGEKEEAKTIKIRMAESETIKVLSASVSSPGFQVETKTIKEGHEYELVVTPDGVSEPKMGVIRIQTDCKVDKFRVQQAFAVVRKSAPANTASKP